MNNFTNLQSQFTNKDNLNLLWNVLLDEFQIDSSNINLINNIKFVFESNINPFISRANKRSNIMELNKQFLSQVVLAVNKLFPNFTNFNGVKQNQEQNIKRITIYSDEDVINEPYKIEDIQASRQSEFDKNVEQKRLDMENYMTPQKPKDLDFSDKNSDVKITSMGSLIAEKMAQRNLEMEQLQNNNFNTNNVENWLTPKETSLKNEKGVSDQKSIIKNNENSRLKHISIDSNNNITLSINNNEQTHQNVSKKVVSWNDLEEREEPTINIFNKLKKQPIIEMDQDNIITTDEKQYVEQKSMPLPNVTREEIIRNQSTLLISNNEAVLPKTEIVKQLNEMNKKIDNLYEMVFKLTGFIEQNKDTSDKNKEDTVL
jgi:hypothetical protein